MTTEPLVSMTINEKITAWHEAQTNAAAWKKIEQAHRKEILVELFDESKKGKQTHTLPDGRVLKANIIHDKKMASHQEVMAALVNVSPAGQAAVRWKAELATVVYKNLEQNDRAWVDTVVTTKPGSHGLELE